MAPLQRGAALFPAAALRSDPGMLLTAARFMGPEVLGMGLMAGQLTVRLGVRFVMCWCMWQALVLFAMTCSEALMLICCW